jgi:hypothetical protein
VSGDGLSLNVPPELVEAIAECVAARLARPEPPEPTPPSNGKLAVSVPGAAELLGVSGDHFRRHVLPDLRIVRSGRLKLVPVVELERWLDAHAARALTGAPLAHDPARPHGKRDRDGAQGAEPGASR